LYAVREGVYSCIFYYDNKMNDVMNCKLKQRIEVKVEGLF